MVTLGLSLGSLQMSHVVTQLVLRLTANEPSGNYGSVLGLIADELCGDSACPWTRCVATWLVLGLAAKEPCGDWACP